MRSLAAPAYCPYLLYIVCKLHKPLCAWEQMALEVCQKAVADNGDAIGIDKIVEPVNDLRRKERKRQIKRVLQIGVSKCIIEPKQVQRL